MSFREPLLLAGLAFVPLALLAYWAAQRRLALGTDAIITDRVDLFPPT